MGVFGKFGSAGVLSLAMASAANADTAVLVVDTSFFRGTALTSLSVDVPDEQACIGVGAGASGVNESRNIRYVTVSCINAETGAVTSFSCERQKCVALEPR